MFCFFLVRYYTDRHESEVLPTVVTVGALTLSLLALLLIPVGILLHLTNMSLHEKNKIILLTTKIF